MVCECSDSRCRVVGDADAVPLVVPVGELTPVALPLGVMLDDPADAAEFMPAS
jgi:hypothetical protein